MNQLSTLAPPSLTAADLAAQFGPMPLSRFCFSPFPGTATEEDVVRLQEREKRLYELVDGILVEKVMAFSESILACYLIQMIRNWLDQHNLGVVAGEGGMMRLAPGLIRIPDVSFVRWEQFPNRKVTLDPVPNIHPDLAIEVLSPSNTAEEMQRKLHDFFNSGSSLVWYVDPRARTVTVYTSPDHFTVLHEGQALDGGDVLPGFTLPLSKLFAELDAH
jgi:Uma2 family endonuclease